MSHESHATTRPRRRFPTNRRRAAALLAVVMLVAGCSKGGSSTTSTTRTGTTRPGTPPTAAYAKRGPYQSGVVRLALADGRRVVVWYPAAASAAEQPKETFDIASLLSPQLQSKIPADMRVQYEIDTHPGAPAAAGGPFPVVLFSHGDFSFPEQSATLTTHLSSWGFVVVAPDHVERSLDGTLGIAARGVPKQTDTEVLRQSLDLAIAEGKRAGSPLLGKVDASRVATIGHSSGAETAYRAAGADPRVDAFISYSVSFDPEPGAPKVAAPPVPKVPGMVMTGSRDGVIPAAKSKGVYERMRGPKWFVEIADAGHLTFSDVCLIGASKGGVAVLAKKAGLDIPADLLAAAVDGCGRSFVPVTRAFPAIDHLSVAFLRSALGIDKKPVGLDPTVTRSFAGVKVTLDSVKV
ncbi:MAG: hypothetical protein JWM05_2675 [Acidimicrobiales bacterium]|nr:hypothetical protein [Acidimicrobiales bacterium]